MATLLPAFESVSSEELMSPLAIVLGFAWDYPDLHIASPTAG